MNAPATAAALVPITVVETNRPGTFDRAAGWYDGAAALFSWGRIKAAKLSQIKHLKRGDKVLYLGVGTGEDAVAACKVGAQVTCIDLSRRMLENLAAKLAKDGLTAELICGDVFAHRKFEQYDAVAANFFLNCFHDEPMIRALLYTAGHVRKGGLMLIADVAPLVGGPFSRLWQWSYNLLGIVPFWAMGYVPFHRVYDYGQYLPIMRMSIEKTEDFRLLPFGPPAFRSIVCRRAE